MRPFAQVLPTFWVRGSGKELRGDFEAQLLALYLFTSPNSNMIGLYFVSLPTISHEVGIGLGQIRDVLKRLADRGIAFYDEAAELVWLPEGANIQIGTSLKPTDKRRSAIQKELDQAGSHPFAYSFTEKYGEAFGVTVAKEKIVSIPNKPLLSNEEAPPSVLFCSVPSPGCVSGAEDPSETGQEPEPRVVDSGTQVSSAKRCEDAFGGGPGFRPDVEQLHSAWKTAIGWAAAKLNRNGSDALVLYDAIKLYGLEDCLVVARNAPLDGMVSGKDDERKKPHRSVAYIFGNSSTFNRILHAAKGGDKPVKRKRTAEEILADQQRMDEEAHKGAA